MGLLPYVQTTVKKRYAISDSTALPFKISNILRIENKGVSILKWGLFCNESGVCCFSRNKFGILMAY